MSPIDITKDLENATLVVTSVLSASPDRVWRLWADPRQLERWWGPDPYPATVVDHDLRPGGHVSYYMTSPEGEQFKGYWRVLEVDSPRRLAFEDGFADDAGEPDDELPVSRAVVTVERVDDERTRMTITSEYDTSADLEQALALGMEEGIRTAVEQIHTLLATAPRAEVSATQTWDVFSTLDGYGPHADDFDLEPLESRTLDSHTLELVYRPSPR